MPKGRGGVEDRESRCTCGGGEVTRCIREKLGDSGDVGGEWIRGDCGKEGDGVLCEYVTLGESDDRRGGG